MRKTGQLIVFIVVLLFVLSGLYLIYSQKIANNDNGNQAVSVLDSENTHDIIEDEEPNFIDDEANGSVAVISNFEECVAAGNAILESYPRQCRVNNQTFTENIGNDLEMSDLIQLDSPRPNDKVNSPLLVHGRARGNWFFEASFPVSLVDWDGRIIAEGIAQAQSDWMTEEFVPFTLTLNYKLDENIYSHRGALILQKDNPSGLPSNDNALEIPLQIY